MYNLLFITLIEVDSNQEIFSKIMCYAIPFVDTLSVKNLKFSQIESKANYPGGFKITGDIDVRGDKQTVQGKYLSNLFLVGEKDGGCCPVVNLKLKFFTYLNYLFELIIIRTILS